MAEEKPGEAVAEALKIRVTFDAGGPGSSVDSNPQVLRPGKKGAFWVQWELCSKLNTFPAYDVEFGNVVPCNLVDVADYHFKSKPVLDPETEKRTGWSWKLKPRKGSSVDAFRAIEYEIFFHYRPKGPSDRRYTSRLSKSFPVDPSLIVPPAGSGPLAGGSK